MAHTSQSFNLGVKRL